MQLVADIGGTNTRLALVEHGRPIPDTLLSVRNAGFDDFYAVLRHYLTETGGAPPSALCVAIAGPVKGNAGELTNLAWHMQTDRLAQVAGADRAVLMNDLAALAHAMAGNGEALQKIIDEAKGPAGDLLSVIATAFGALAGQRWDEAIALLTQAMADHARMGGSRAQRDLLEYALLNALLKQGHEERARMLLALRRPLKADAHAVAGL